MTGTLSIYSQDSANPLQVRLEGSGTAQPDASSGGCSLSDGRSPFDPALWLWALVAALVVWRRGRR